LGLNIVFRKDLCGYDLAFKLQGYWTKVHWTFLPNARGISVDQILVQFLMSLSIPEIFAAEV